MTHVGSATRRTPGGDGAKRASPGAIEYNIARTAGTTVVAQYGTLPASPLSPTAVRVLVVVTKAWLKSGQRGCVPYRGDHQPDCGHRSGRVGYTLRHVPNEPQGVPRTHCQEGCQEPPGTRRRLVAILVDRLINRIKVQFGLAYSPFEADYMALCAKCHWHHDAAIRRSRAEVARMNNVLTAGALYRRLQTPKVKHRTNVLPLTMRGLIALGGSTETVAELIALRHLVARADGSYRVNYPMPRIPVHPPVRVQRMG
jgi:hypothetical protein